MTRIGLTLALLCTMAVNGFSQGDIKISGVVYQRISDIKGDSLVALQNINVINIRTYNGVSSDEEGFFSIPVTAGDTLLFSSVTHFRDTFVVSADEHRKSLFLRVVLLPANYRLKAVEVYGKDFEGFRYDFVHMDVDDSQRVWLAPAWEVVEPRQGFGITINGPITALWNALSKQGRELKKLNTILEKERRQAFIDSVYKRPMVLHFLELDEDEIDDLIDYCALSDAFIARSTEFEFLQALERCYKEFKLQGN